MARAARSSGVRSRCEDPRPDAPDQHSCRRRGIDRRRRDRPRADRPERARGRPIPDPTDRRADISALARRRGQGDARASAAARLETLRGPRRQAPHVAPAGRSGPGGSGVHRVSPAGVGDRTGARRDPAGALGRAGGRARREAEQARVDAHDHAAGFHSDADPLTDSDSDAEPDPNAEPDAHTNPVTHSDPDAHADANAVTDATAVTDADSDADSGPVTYADPGAHADSDSDSDSHAAADVDPTDGDAGDRGHQPRARRGHRPPPARALAPDRAAASAGGAAAPRPAPGRIAAAAARLPRLAQNCHRHALEMLR